MRFDIAGISVDLIDADDRICLGVKQKAKPFEPNTLAYWAENCHVGSQVLDVGAYSGLFSMVAAKKGAIPIAIEPMPELVERIYANSEINGVKFEVLQAAADERDGTARLGYNDRVPMTSGASLLRTVGKQHIVRTLRLEAIRGLTNLSAIKIDVERAEMAVLKGAMKLICRELPVMIIEVLDLEARRAVEQFLSATHRSKGMFDNRNLIMEPH